MGLFYGGVVMDDIDRYLSEGFNLILSSFELLIQFIVPCGLMLSMEFILLSISL